MLQAGTKPFSYFSFLGENGGYNEVARTFKEISKTKGNPTLNQKSSSFISKDFGNIPLKTFPNKIQYEASPTLRAKTITPFLKWILKISE